jgi:hypothetical protein
MTARGPALAAVILAALAGCKGVDVRVSSDDPNPGRFAEQPASNQGAE